MEEHLCIAVPDYRCFWQYKHAVDELADPATMGVMVMSRDRFHDMFGVNATFRSILELALYGMPSLCIAKAFALSP